MFFNKENLIDTFQSLPDNIETYVKNIPEELLDRKRSETAWTIREHIYHIAWVQDMLYQRILTVKEEPDPVITPYFPENELGRDALFESMDKAFEHYRSARKKQIGLIAELSDEEMKKNADHEEYTRYNIPIIINHMIFHEYWHMYRVEELWLARDKYFS